LVKRKADIKDFAGYLPGHGGLMDRIDGITFNAVFIFIVMEIIALL
jgi:phosphatidate cytidylyltransferase